MAMAMVNVRIVGMAMEHYPMCMEVAVGFLTMLVSVVFVRGVSMVVLQWLVPVLMSMSFEVEPYPYPASHQHRGGHELDRQTVAEKNCGRFLSFCHSLNNAVMSC